MRLFNNDVNPDDLLYLDRREMLIKAVEAYNREQPASDLLYNGDTDKVVQRLLPICESLYSMPAMRPESGTERWFTYMKDNINQATFGDLVKNSELLRIYVKQMKKNGDRQVCYRVSA